eukprot:scaffold32357_cov53-Phaeocystis_antarctica.AAC.3
MRRLNRVRDAGVAEGFGTDLLERGRIRQVQAREFGLEEGVLPDLLDGRAQLKRALELALALQEVVWDDLQVRVDELPDNLPVGALLHAVFGEDALLHICPAQQVVCVEAAPLGGQRHLENGQRGGFAAPGCQVARCGYPALPEDDGRQMHTACTWFRPRCLTLSLWAWWPCDGCAAPTTNGRRLSGAGVPRWPCDGCAAPTTNGRRLPGAGVPTAAARHPSYSYSYSYSYSTPTPTPTPTPRLLLLLLLLLPLLDSYSYS